MTIEEAIGRADALAPNQYTQEQKLAWLSDLDGKTARELRAVHGEDQVPAVPEAGYTTTGETLLIPAPYAGDVYVSYLLSRVAEANAEIQKYNLYAALFNTAYGQFAAWFNRAHRPRRAGEWVV